MFGTRSANTTFSLLFLLFSRYIELSNGLRALLISDLSGLDGKAEDEEEEDSEEEEEEEERDEGEEEEGDSGEGTDEESEDEGDSQDSDFEELDEDSERKKKKGSEKQVFRFNTTFFTNFSSSKMYFFYCEKCYKNIF